MDQDEVTLLLSGVRILQHLELDAIDDIAGSIHTRNYAAGDKLVVRGQRGERLHILVSGHLTVHVTDKFGRAARTVGLTKGAIVGEMSLLSDEPCNADIVADSPVCTLCIERGDFRRLIHQHKGFAEALSNLVSERLAKDEAHDQVGRYILRERLGEGAMSIVFNAWDPELEREVAIKMLKYELASDPDFHERFEREAKIIAGLNQANIVKVFEIIEEYSTRFIVMEKVGGRNIKQLLAERGAFSAEETTRILYKVACALQHAHTSGIVHRDIKPSNIQIDEEGLVKLTDFGIAGPPGEALSEIAGSPSYIAPEMIRGEAVDGRADIYSLGVVAFQMLTNQLPFNADNLDELLRLHLEEPIPPLRAHVTNISEALVVFIDAALAKDPNHRLYDWKDIRGLLKTAGRDLPLEFGHDEVGLVVRMHDTRLDDAAPTIREINAVLRKAGVNYSIETRFSTKPK